MPSDFELTGADQFLKLSKALKQAGRTELRKELNKAMSAAVKPALPQAGAALAKGLPGPLKARGRATKQVVKVKTGANPGITVGVLFGKRGRGLGTSNARLANKTGMIRHPVFPDRDADRKSWKWVNQKVTASRDWFDDTYTDRAPEIRVEVEKAMQSIVEKIIREAR